MDIGALEIDRYHREEGWLEIGYHYVIRLDGTIETGRNPDAVGAHARGYNKRSIGVCLVGGVDDDFNPEDTFSGAQIGALQKLVAWIRNWYGDVQVIGHNEVSAKACPSFNVSERLPGLTD